MLNLTGMVANWFSELLKICAVGAERQELFLNTASYAGYLPTYAYAIHIHILSISNKQRIRPSFNSTNRCAQYQSKNPTQEKYIFDEFL